MKRYIVVSAMLGLVAPFAWVVAIVMIGEERLSSAVIAAPWISGGLLIFWPASFGLLLATETIDASLLALLFAANFIFYGVLGALIWIGVHKSRWAFLWLVLGLAVLFGRILQLYFGW